MAQSEDSTSGNSSRRKKSLPAVIGGAVLVLAAGYFGIDLTSGGSGDSGTSSSASSAGSESAVAETVSSDSETCEISSLPEEAEETRDDIVSGGPYEYPENDNRRFGNYEGVLPDQSSDFYREYTVETPGLDHRGARRIVTGGGSETDPEVWYYTDDHYESFCEIPDAE